MSTTALQLDLGGLSKELRRLYSRGARARVTEYVSTVEEGTDLTKYRDDPVGFAKDRLRYIPTADQENILRALPGRVKVNAGHSVGKTSIAAVVVIWWFCTRPRSVVITTAPTERDVIDLLWTEIRLLCARAGLDLPFSGPRAPEMFDNEEHWAKGYTARRGESFQGRHRESMLFVFDESEGVDPIYWTTTDTMYKPGLDHAWLAIGNPISTSSQSYLEDLAVGADGRPKWKQFVLSSLNHPNIHAELNGLPPPVPNAVSLAQVQDWIKQWSERVQPAEKRAGDFEWPPGSGIWYRPGPLMKARALGIRPTEGVDTVWGQAAWEIACTPKFTPQQVWLHKHGITIGVDVAVYGDDDSTIHIRSGPLSVHHESHNGWMPHRLADRIKSLCVEWCAWYNAHAVIPTRTQLTPKEVKVIIELDGPGVAVLDRCDGFGNWTGLKVAESSEVIDNTGTVMYFNKRSELWVTGRDKALAGKMDLSRLPQDVKDRLQIQLLTPTYTLRTDGSIQVEEKKEIKKRLKRSPDDADGLLVCYTDARTWAPEVLGNHDDE
jgi:hypothetical protein